MTETKINLSDKQKKCNICTGCGRCVSAKPLHVLKEFLYPKELNAEIKRGTDLPPYLIVADIGTTTIVMQLRDSESGQILESFVKENPQREYGTDVLSRIEAAGNIANKNRMRQLVLDVLTEGITQFGVQGMLIIAANTTMVHLLMGYDTAGMGRYPFTAENLEEIKTQLCGLETLILPGVSAFVGGDITAGITALSIHKRKEISLLLDLGTNGEIVLGNKDKLFATATAAGPAFEGATGMYGTDLISLIARLLQEGVVDETGLLCDPYFESGITIGGVRITQDYIRTLQVAKAAVCTGICILASRYGLSDLNQIDKVYLAGGMGYYLNPVAAVRIGLLPAVLADKTYSVGNAALEGAFCYVGDEKESEKPCCEVLQLAEEEKFEERYISNMFLKPYKGDI